MWMQPSDLCLLRRLPYQRSETPFRGCDGCAVRLLFGQGKFMISIRLERSEDIGQVLFINRQAFEQLVESRIVDALHKTCPDLLSLVADDDNRLVGHILFSPVAIEGTGRKVMGMGLSPMAVLPACQRKGIGSALVRHGVALLRERNCPFISVLGHPEFYPRFGFEIASKYDLSSQWAGVPDEAFMVLILNDGIMKGVSGIVRYRDEFSQAME